MIEKLRKSFDSRGVQLFFLIELAKKSDSLPYDLLIAKLHADGIKKEYLNSLFSYIKNRKQRVHLNNTDSERIEILFGVPQGPTLCPLLFNISFTRSLFVPP